MLAVSVNCSRVSCFGNQTGNQAGAHAGVSSDRDPQHVEPGGQRHIHQVIQFAVVAVRHELNLDRLRSMIGPVDVPESDNTARRCRSVASAIYLLIVIVTALFLSGLTETVRGDVS